MLNDFPAGKCMLRWSCSWAWCVDTSKRNKHKKLTIKEKLFLLSLVDGRSAWRGSSDRPLKGKLSFERVVQVGGGTKTNVFPTKNHSRIAISEMLLYDPDLRKLTSSESLDLSALRNLSCRQLFFYIAQFQRCSLKLMDTDYRHKYFLSKVQRVT